MFYLGLKKRKTKLPTIQTGLEESSLTKTGCTTFFYNITKLSTNSRTWSRFRSEKMSLGRPSGILKHHQEHEILNEELKDPWLFIMDLSFLNTFKNTFPCPQIIKIKVMCWKLLHIRLFKLQWIFCLCSDHFFLGLGVGGRHFPVI